MNIKEIEKPYCVKTVYVHLTRACNLRCSYCYFAAGEAMKLELSPNEFSLLFKEILSLAAKKVVFTGGEPLLRTDLFDIALAFREADPSRQIRLCIVSNGILIDARRAYRIAQVFDEVRISVDGPLEVNDKLRGKGVFQGAMKAIHYLRSAGAHSSVSITVTAVNLPYLSDFLSFLFQEKLVTEFHLAPFRPVGRGAEHSDFVCSWREAQLAVADFWRSHFGAPSRLGEADAYKLVGCGNCGIGSYINIHPDGSVYPCHVLSVPEFFLGNVRQTKLLDIVWESSTLKRLRDLDFKHLTRSSERLKQLLNNAICLGEVYRDAPEEFEKFK